MPVDSKKLNEINDAQLIWYQLQDSLDNKDRFEMLRDIAEHNAMFMNPEGVQKVREARENTFETTDEEFDDILTNTFGRALPKVDESEKKDLSELMREAQDISYIDPYLEMELDEVKFTPF